MKRPSWLKKPETTLGMVTTGIVGVAILAAGTASAFALVSTPKNTQNDAVTANTAENSQNQPLSSDNAAQTSDSTPTTASDSTNSAATGQNSAQTTTNTPAAQQTTPTVPATPSYSDTYPAGWKNQCGQLDTWGLNKCQSPSYTAFKVNEAFGNMPKWGIGRSVSGDAQNWPTLAAQDNIPTGTTAKLHSVGIRGNWSVWVEAVHDDGTIDISFYNLNNSQAYGTQLNVKQSAFSTYIYFGN